MKFFKRFLCLLLSVLMLLGTLSGCSSKKTDEEIYLTKGEFFAYFVYENDMTSDIYTYEEIQSCLDGSVEAEIIVEWGYLSEEKALKNLNNPVTKEIVVMVCANATFDLKEGNIADIKDADLLEDPQLIANAYASGFFELENGYFDGAEKMTFAECEEILERAGDYTANFHYEANEEVYEIEDNIITYDGIDYNDGDIVVDFFGEGNVTDKSAEVTGTDFSFNLDDAPKVSFLGTAQPTYLETKESNEKDATIKSTATTPNQLTTVNGFSATIAKNVFEKQLNNPKVGDTVIMSKYQTLLSNHFGNNEIIGVLKSAQLRGTYYDCIFDYPVFEEAILKKNVAKSNVSGIDKGSFVKETDEYMGWKLKFDISGNSVSVKATKDFTVYETGRKQDWQNSKKTVTATASLSLTDFNVDVNNLKSFASKKGTGYIKVTCDSAMDFSLSTSLRYTPDSNRNGKFPSNWNNSRWTDRDSKGAKEIKIAKFTPTNGVVGVDVYVYLRISIDGKVSFRTSVDNGGVMISTNNGKISCKKLGTKKTEVSANINLLGKIGVDVNLKIFGFINVVEYDVGVNLDATALADLYYEEELSTSGVFADEEGLNEYEADDNKFQYCIGISAEFSVLGELKDSGVKLILNAISKGTSFDFKRSIWTWSVHFEDGSFVEKCTRGKDSEDTVNVSSDDEIELSTYKVIMDNYTCTTVSLGAIPSDSADFYNSTNAITVKSKDESIVKASFNKKNKTIILDTTGEGSTEIVITAKKGILWWKKTVEQSIAVTVNPNNYDM